MIFVTVGAQMPFDRLIRAMDAWAANNPDRTCFAQVGCGGYQPRHMRFEQLLAPAELRDEITAATVVVAHAGMGTILTARDAGRPLVVLPRRGDLRETRNDHQVATAERLEAAGLLSYARDERELQGILDRGRFVPPPLSNSRDASSELILALCEFIAGAPTPRSAVSVEQV